MIIGTVILIACVYFYIDFLDLKKNSLLIDSFEKKIGIDTVDYGSSPNSVMTASASTKVSRCGNQSLQLDYDLKPSGYVYCAKGYGLHLATDSSTWIRGRTGWLVHPDKIQWDDFGAFSVYLRGNNNGKVAIDVKDSGGELWRHLVKVDFKGWKRFTIPFDKFSVRTDWQPDTASKNRIMDFPLKSFQFEPKDPGKGTLHVDCAKFVEL